MITPILSVYTHREEDTAFLTLTGEADVSSAPRLEETLRDLTAAGCLHLCIDMEKVAYIDLAGLRTFLNAGGWLSPWGGSVRLVGCGPFLRKVLYVTGIDRCLSLYDTFSEAVESIETGGAASPFVSPSGGESLSPLDGQAA